MNKNNKINIWKNNYVENQVKKVILPEFGMSDVERWQVEFFGKVQKVGFRLEIFLLAVKLDLSGYVKNLPEGNVLMEVEGETEKIMYLIEFMKGLKRAKVKDVLINKIERTGKKESFYIEE